MRRSVTVSSARPSQAAKVDLLAGELDARDRGRTLVFVRTKRGADRLVKKLRARDIVAVAMHGDKSQSQRQNALARFERGDVTVLIATDVAARGIDVPDVTHVINFDAPEDGDAYTHRVGRTGRAGATGSGVTFVLADQVHDMRAVARRLGLAAEFDRRDGAQRARPAVAPALGATTGAGVATAATATTTAATATIAPADLVRVERPRQHHPGALGGGPEAGEEGRAAAVAAPPAGRGAPPPPGTKKS